jgi:transcriptional regulator NrdR family protein
MTASWYPQDRQEQGTSSFPCPSCGGPTGVLDSRPVRTDFVGIRRRRRCARCETRFTTRERIWVAEERDERALQRGVVEALAELQRRLLDYLPDDD